MPVARRALGVLVVGMLLFPPPARGLADSPPAPAAEACPDGADAPPEATAAASAPLSDADTLKTLPTLALGDALYVLGSPARWTGKDWAIAGGTAVGIILVSALSDVTARNQTRAHRSGALDELTRVVEPFGSEYSFAVLGAYGVAGLAFHDADARDTAVDGILASVLASGIITPSLKLALGRARPTQTDQPLSFHPFQSGYSSLPSGHATQAFAVASVISAHSDKLWVDVSAYTLAGLVAFARVYHNAHWTSDVAAGALIGTAVGQGVVRVNDRIRSGDGRVKVTFAPMLGDREGAAVTIVF